MLIIPAIDIMDGKCVRLFQGKADSQTIYSDNPVDFARKWQSEGAEYLHLVDLDGAFQGSIKNIEAIRAIVEAVTIPAELGGGIRDAKTVKSVLDTGVARVIIGTRACDLDFVRELLSEFGEKIVVGIDAKDGMVSVKGWEETTSLKALDFARQIEDVGVKTIIYTDIARDGALEGPNLSAIAEMLGSVETDIIASGGVTTTADIKALSTLKPRPLAGVIIGKALYNGNIMLKDAFHE